MNMCISIYIYVHLLHTHKHAYIHAYTQIRTYIHARKSSHIEHHGHIQHVLCNLADGPVMGSFTISLHIYFMSKVPARIWKRPQLHSLAGGCPSCLWLCSHRPWPLQCQQSLHKMGLRSAGWAWQKHSRESENLQNFNRVLGPIILCLIIRNPKIV